MPIWKCNGKEKVNNNQKKRIYFKILNLLLVIIHGGTILQRSVGKYSESALYA